ncbi:MAG: hypothetical protein ABJE95_06885 [Byssovorax sp.]
MMTEHTRPTLTSPHLPIVLAVGCAPALLARVEAAAKAFSSILSCDLTSAHQLVADVRPCVLVVSASLFDFDGPKFTDLADDAQAALVVLEDDEPPVDALEARLCDAVNRTRAMRPPWREGRYSVVAERQSAPSSRRTAGS